MKNFYAACTVISKNYFSEAKSLAKSFLKYHTDGKFYILITDEIYNDDLIVAEDGIETVFIDSLNIPNVNFYAFKFDPFEFNCNLKATFIKFLITAKNLEKILYFDADIIIYNELSLIVGLLDDYNIILTPHAVSPIDNYSFPSEVGFLISGVFNMGFLAVNNSKESLKFLQWWESRCLEHGYNEVQSGFFADQKWIDLVPYYFEDVYVVRHLGCNMGFWNFHERNLSKVNNQFLVNDKDVLLFFHFSGFNINNINIISKAQNRYTLANRKDLIELYEEYRKTLLNEGYHHYKTYKNKYVCYANGKKISLLARRMYDAHYDKFSSDNPFDANGDFYQWLKKMNLVEEMTSLENSLIRGKDAIKNDIKVKILNKSLRIIERCIGVERYTLLLKYLLYISSLRNQKDIFIK